MATPANLSGQFGEVGAHHQEMAARMGSEGGFTWNPRFNRYETEGYSVSPYKERESVTSGSTGESVRSYHEANADILSEKPHMLGGWAASPTEHYLDVAKVYPPTGGGQSAARYQAVKHSQEGIYSLHEGETQMNPFRPGSEKFPEFAALATSGHSMSQVMKTSPEIAAYVQSPSRREKWAQGAGASPPPGAS